MTSSEIKDLRIQDRAAWDRFEAHVEGCVTCGRYGEKCEKAEQLKQRLKDTFAAIHGNAVSEKAKQ
ncbi:hypothetical protein ACFUN8_30520 [Streptomyces sp. NPDC057307]|uniref:hypothetical protein n=1 Tax=Streptomyces sp. NPDC057307 TaxID=3346096 RepID=UPI003628D030